MRLIDADAAVNLVQRMARNYHTIGLGDVAAEYEAFACVLSNKKCFPTIDTAPVAHARWVESEFPEEKYCCSACGCACWYYDYEGEVAKSRYCPTCGAKMDGKEDENASD